MKHVCEALICKKALSVKIIGSLSPKALKCKKFGWPLSIGLIGLNVKIYAIDSFFVFLKYLTLYLSSIYPHFKKLVYLLSLIPRSDLFLKLIKIWALSLYLHQ